MNMNNFGNFLPIVLLYFCGRIILTVGQQQDCPGTDWVERDQYCYYVPYFAALFQTAETQCQSESSHLVSIQSFDENDFVYNYFKEEWPTARESWIGMYKEEDVLADYQWTDGSVVNYTRWAPEEPNNPIFEHCVVMYTYTPGENLEKQWNNIKCTDTRPYMCKYEKGVPGGNTTIPSPRYSIAHNISFTSGSGQDFTPECTQAYSLQINQNAQQTMATVNQKIGDTVCPGISSEQIKLFYTSCPFTTSGPTGSAFPSYLLTTVPDLTLAEVHDCMNEISDQLASFDNWPGGSVLQPEENCDDVVFESTEFGISGNAYVCLGSVNVQEKQGAVLTFTKEAFLNFGKTHQGDFTTDFPLTAQCLNLYNTQFAVTVFNMADQVNDVISSGGLCANEDPVLIRTVSPLFMSVNDFQGTTLQRFVFNSTNTNTFTEFSKCTGEVSNYLKLHSNWPDPILDPIDGCGTITWTGDFQEVDEEWICREQAA